MVASGAEKEMFGVVLRCFVTEKSGDVEFREGTVLFGGVRVTKSCVQSGAVAETYGSDQHW